MVFFVFIVSNFDTNVLLLMMLKRRSNTTCYLNIVLSFYVISGQSRYNRDSHCARTDIMDYFMVFL